VSGTALIALARPGQKVCIGDRGEICATVEEVIWARGMNTPFYLVEWWHEGQLVSRRVHEGDCK
jgi:hypothetical protein